MKAGPPAKKPAEIRLISGKKPLTNRPESAIVSERSEDSRWG